MNNLHTFRKLSHLSQDLLAQFLDVSTSHIDALEKGTVPFTTVQLQKVCSLFDCSEEEMLGQEDIAAIPMDLRNKSLDDLKAIAHVLKIKQNIEFMDELVKTHVK